MRASRVSRLLAAALIWSLCGAARAEGELHEGRARRFETVFLISLPFTALYSGILTLGAAAAIESGIKGGSLTIGPAYQITAAALALTASALIARNDARARREALTMAAMAYPGSSAPRPPGWARRPVAIAWANRGRFGLLEGCAEIALPPAQAQVVPNQPPSAKIWLGERRPYLPPSLLTPG